MSTAIETLSNLKKAYEDACKDLGKQYITEALAPLWEAAPTLRAVSWKQYTPYFNDGDPCEFRVCEIYDGLFDGEDEETEDGHWATSYRENLWVYSGTDDPVLQALAGPLETANGHLQDNEQMLQQMFGDHALVIVWRDGRVQIEEYDHD